MKKIVSRVAILSVIVMAVSFSASAQVYVTVRPPAPRIVRPVQPSPAHVWIEEDWNGRGDHYEYGGGRWMLPPHPGWVWVPGRWVHARRGWQWMPGRWRRGRRY
ncbi:MAG TPA: hypothetical protein VKT28_10220 [Puia sp.]|nr:hypothetical protein [Puia sp.]